MGRHSDKRKEEIQPARSPAGRWIGAALLLLITLVAYAPVFHAGFIWDDFQYIRDNPVIQDPAGLGQIWFDLHANPQFYPLTFSTFWIEHQLWGLNPAGYHVVNVLLHMMNVLLVWVVLRRLAVPGAWLAAALFAVHPVHVESVAWVVERKNVLSGVFYLLAALAYLQFSGIEASPEPTRRWGWYGMSLLMLAGALLSKTVVCTLPAAILLVLWWKRDRLAWQDVWPLLPMAAMGVGMALLTGWVEKNVTCATEPLAILPWTDRLLIAGRAIWFYLGKLVWPSGLCPIYPRWQIDPHAWRQYLFPTAGVVAAIGLWRARRRIGKGPLTAFLFFVGSSLPTLGVISLAYQRFSFVADHFQYLADIAPLALAAATLTWATGRRTGGQGTRTPDNKRQPETTAAFQASTALLVLVLMIMTWRQGRLYKDEVTIWTHATEANPASGFAWYNLGYAQAEQERLPEAEAAYTQSFTVEPSQTRSRVNLAVVLIRQNRFDEAARQLEQAIREQPTLGEAHLNLGYCRQQQKRIDEALKCYQLAVQYSPDNVIARRNLGVTLLAAGRPSDAIEHLREYTRLNPGDLQGYDRLMAACAETGRLGEAVEAIQRGIRLTEAAHREDLTAQLRERLDAISASKVPSRTHGER